MISGRLKTSFSTDFSNHNKTLIKIDFDSESINSFKKFLSDFCKLENKELKLYIGDFSGNKEKWTMHFKISASKNRSMVSHPEKDEWVGVLIFPKEFYMNLNKELNKEKFNLMLSEFIKLDNLSNLDVLLKYDS